jgi:anti-sigma-K factor RskA
MTIDLHTLSGAYAIDALSAEEAEEFRSHLQQCPACRDEVRELQEAAARMGASEALVAPPSLKARVLAAADQAPQLPPKVAPSVGRDRPRRLLPRLLVAAAAVVLVVGGAIGIANRGDDDSRPPAVAAAVRQVFDAADAHTAEVRTANGGRVAVATSQDLGRMAVETEALPEPGRQKVYQLWTIHNGTPTSAGLVDDLAAGEAMAIPAAGTTVAITIEPAGGSDLPTTEPIVEMDPQQV